MTTPGVPAVEAESLLVNYGPVTALAGVNLAVPAGSLFVLAGPDGAGKSTLLRVLAGLLVPSGGSYRLEGHQHAARDPEKRRRLGYLAQGFTLYGELTVEENLQFFGDLYEIPVARMRLRIEELLAWADLARFRNRRAGALSGGMKQKLSLSALLLHEPHLLLLDEPTTGVDAPTRREFWNYLLQLKQQGLTTLVATPYLEEARQADQVAFLHEGRVVTQDSPAALLRGLEGRLYELSCPDPQTAKQALLRSGRLTTVVWRSRQVRMMLPERMSEEGLRGLLAELELSGELAAVEPGFEDVFFRLSHPGS